MTEIDLETSSVLSRDVSWENMLGVLFEPRDLKPYPAIALVVGLVLRTHALKFMSSNCAAGTIRRTTDQRVP